MIVSEFSDENTHRSATIVQGHAGDTRIVFCYAQKAFVKEIDVSNHSYQYAEDTAENWTLGIIKHEET